MRSRLPQPTTRVEAFSDAVLAFSATLLVVSLEVPDTFSELRSDLHGFAAFGFSFAALILIWYVHHSFFKRYPMEDLITVFLNSCLLFVVLFYVYPLKFVSRGIVASISGAGAGGGGVQMVRGTDELASLFVLYGAGLSAVFACFSLMYVHAWRRRDALGVGPDDSYHAPMMARHYAIFVAVGLASVVLAAAKVGIGYLLPAWVYFLLGPLCAIHGILSERLRKRSP
jgi:hypothetical protein